MFTREQVDTLAYLVEKGFLSQDEAHSVVKQSLEKNGGFAFPEPVTLAEVTPPAPEAPVV